MRVVPVDGGVDFSGLRFQKFEILEAGFGDAFYWAEGDQGRCEDGRSVCPFVLAFVFRIGDAAVGGGGGVWS